MRRLHVDLAHRLFVGLPDDLPLVLEAALELVDARGRLVEQPALDVVPLAQPPMQFRHGGRVLLVAIRPALEDRRALARHVRQALFEILQGILGVTELLEGDGDLLELQVQFRWAWFSRSFAIRGACLVHSARMIRQTAPRTQAIRRRRPAIDRSNGLQSSRVNRTMLS